MHIEVVSHKYPSKKNPHDHTFIRDQVLLLKQVEDVSTGVTVITPYAIPITTRWKVNTSHLYDSDISNRVFYLSFPRKKLLSVINWNLGRKLKRSLPRKDNQIIHLHWAYPAGITIPQLVAKGFRCVLTIHGSDWYQNINDPRLKKYLEKAIDSASMVLLDGPRLKKAIISNFPYLERKLKVMYNYVDPEFFTLPDSTQKVEAVKKLNWTTDKNHVLTVANVRKEKGIDILIKSIYELKGKESDDTHFHILGRYENTSYTNYVEDLLYKFDLNNVKFHDPIDREEIVNFYHAADLFVQPSRREGFSVALLEAGACGLPLVATKSGGAEEVIGKDNGEVVPTESPKPLAKAIQKYLNESKKGNDPKKIRSQIVDQYGKEAFKNRLLQVYQSVMV